MGTRNLTMVFKGGKFVVAQYCQWDGYPSGQGVTALNFLRDKFDAPTFERALSQCSEVTNDEMTALWKEVGASGEWVTWDQSKLFKEKYPHLHRDTGAKILGIIQALKPVEKLKLNLEVDFAADGLFCEWGYLVDLDAGMFEVYQGNTTPLEPTDRFYSLPLPKDRNVKYYQIKLVKAWPLDALPTEEEFLAALEPKEDEEAA